MKQWNHTHLLPSTVLVVTAFLALIVLSTISRAAAEPDPSLLEQAAIPGGFVVVLGCDNPELLSRLRSSDAILVQGLDTDPAKVKTARDALRKQGLYGPVSVNRLAGTSLPYIDNMVNLLVVLDKFNVAEAELKRVLAPGGRIVGIHNETKPWPDDIDQWTHTMHDAGANEVARDQRVGPPKHLQWTAPPRWQRSHGLTPSVSAFVSAGGRIFTIQDEALTGLNNKNGQWHLVARDAFNGKLLWKKRINNWDSKSFHAQGKGRVSMPSNLSRRLVATKDAVYVTLGAEAPVSMLDPVTGEQRNVFKGSERADEILVDNGRLIVSIFPEKEAAVAGDPPQPAEGKEVRAYDIQTGRQLWKQGPFQAIRASQYTDPYGRLELVAGDNKVFLMTPASLIGFDATKGLSQNKCCNSR